MFQLKCRINESGGVGVLAMVLISPGQRLLHHLTASIFPLTPTNFPAALLDSQQAGGPTACPPFHPQPAPHSPTLRAELHTASRHFSRLALFLRRRAQSESGEVSAHSTTATYVRRVTSARRPELLEASRGKKNPILQ